MSHYVDITCSTKKSAEIHEFFKAVEAFKHSANRLTEAWEKMETRSKEASEEEDEFIDILNNRAAQLFPFVNDFGQVTKDVRIWAEDLKGLYSKIQGIHIDKGNY